MIDENNELKLNIETQIEILTSEADNILKALKVKDSMNEMIERHTELLNRLKAKKEADKNKLKKYKKSWSEEESFRMIDLLRNGYNYEEVAQKLNRTIEGVKGHHRYKYRWKL